MYVSLKFFNSFFSFLILSISSLAYNIERSDVIANDCKDNNEPTRFADALRASPLPSRLFFFLPVNSLYFRIIIYFVIYRNGGYSKIGIPLITRVKSPTVVYWALKFSRFITHTWLLFHLKTRKICVYLFVIHILVSIIFINLFLLVSLVSIHL